MPSKVYFGVHNNPSKIVSSAQWGLICESSVHTVLRERELEGSDHTGSAIVNSSGLEPNARQKEYQLSRTPI